jgi:hypothetical protein
MKAQIGTLVLSELGWMPFKIHVHDDKWDRWVREDRDTRDELRNLISLHLKRRLGDQAPGFFFVLEDRTTAGDETRPHAHGSIALASASLPLAGEGSRTLRKLAEDKGQARAELEAGRLVIKTALKAAAGANEPRIAVTTGVDQVRNVWTRKTPYHPVFNHQYVDYAFRNTRRVSRTLGDSRFAMTNPLRAESRRLWNLVKFGEEALDQWPA